MSKYYAYKGTYSLGDEPCGSDNKLIFELKTDAGAVRRARRILGAVCRAYRYTVFYNSKTFEWIY